MATLELPDSYSPMMASCQLVNKHILDISPAPQLHYSTAKIDIVYCLEFNPIAQQTLPSHKFTTIYFIVQKGKHLLDISYSYISSWGV